MNILYARGTRCVGYLYSGSEWFDCIEPARTFFNHYIDVIPISPQKSDEYHYFCHCHYFYVKHLNKHFFLIVMRMLNCTFALSGLFVPLLGGGMNWLVRSDFTNTFARATKCVGCSSHIIVCFQFTSNNTLSTDQESYVMVDQLDPGLTLLCLGDCQDKCWSWNTCPLTNTM